MSIEPIDLDPNHAHNRKARDMAEKLRQAGASPFVTGIITELYERVHTLEEQQRQHIALTMQLMDVQSEHVNALSKHFRKIGSGKNQIDREEEQR